jgi:hypothetical protein
MAALTPGSRWASRVCTTEVIVVKGPGTDVDLTCGGAAMVAPGGAPTGAPDPAAADGTQLGKRYVDADETVEMLCTKPGDGSLAIGGSALDIKATKPLPASD